MTSSSSRWLALDILRGLSVIGMLLVVNPGAWEQHYSWLSHTEWAGICSADMIFPTFLFCVGMALPLSLSRRLMAGSSVQSLYVRVLWRSAALVLLGVVLNAFPTFDWGSVRIPGVLQRIGLCYGLVGALMLTFSEKSQQGVAINLRALVIAVLILLLSYWALLSFVAAPGALAPAYDSVNSLPAYVDRQIFGLQHLWPYGTTDGKVTYDPEGLLSTLPACINVIIGALVTCIYQRNASKSNASLALIAVSLLVLGLLLGTFFPIIKKIWSSSFALFSSGVSVALLVVINQCRFSIKSLTPSYPIHVFGANALLAFAVSTIIGSLMDFPVHILGQETSVRSYGFNLFLAMVGNPQAASFLYSLLVVFLIFLLMSLCYQKRWFLRL